MSSSDANLQLVPVVAPKEILSISAASNGAKRGSKITTDPTMGALVVAPEYDLKIRKAIWREIGRIKRRLFLSRFRLKIEYLTLKMRCALLHLLNRLAGHLSNR